MVRRLIMELLEAVKSHFNSEVLTGKGGFFIKGHGFITIAQARKITGVKAKPRQTHQRIMPYGDYATIAQINGIKI